ncbi:MAG: triose-phosphate isomerase [Candidatus Staskawiczbacteria bacterium]|nr:triose-phosphate isomerase [Candidatus Staskawiczbacteria bacterium]
MEKLIVANWKLNPITFKEAKDLFGAVKKHAKVKNTQVVICPPFVYLPLLKGLSLGSQNISSEQKGAFTGEISALQLKDLNIEYVIIGHSERRKHFSETNETVNKKIKMALEAGLKVIFCIGENEGEEKNTILQNQITKGLADVLPAQMEQVVIAYEPVWAIGTGKNCSTEETKSAVESIKNTLISLYGSQIAENTRILYGGSVNSTNSAEYLKNGEVNGLLIGGASLKPDEFIAIVKSTE